MEVMSDKEAQIISTFSRVIPKLPEDSKSYLLGLGEGLSFRIEQVEKHTLHKNTDNYEQLSLFNN